MEIKIKEQEYIATHFKNRAKILENIDNFMKGKVILEIDKFQNAWKWRYGEFVRKGVVLRFGNGDILDVRVYKDKYADSIIVFACASAYNNKTRRWKWLGMSYNDKTVCELVENFVDKCSSLKEELNNKVDNELKRNFGRFYISRG
jgi:hypothetical protein